jgi:hypothetical protein
MRNKTCAGRSTERWLVPGIVLVLLLLAFALVYVGWTSDAGDPAATVLSGSDLQNPHLRARYPPDRAQLSRQLARNWPLADRHEPAKKHEEQA